LGLLARETLRMVSSVSSTTITATNDRPFTRNETDGPHSPSRYPPRAGPSTRATLKLTALSAIASGISSRGTSSGTSECHGGLLIELAMPRPRLAAKIEYGPASPR
jgi:hypothetical protein